jgi:putative ABC transport system ATP-binding protein
MTAILRAIGVHKRYQMGAVTVHALRGVDFEVVPGEFVAIMGPSGSGKSTLLHLLGGLDRPSEGAVLLGERQLAQLSDDEVSRVRRREIGFVFQFFNLLPTLTAVENVALPLLLDGRAPEAHATRIKDVMGLVGLAERQEHRPDQLSGGEQQRVAIARALVTEPLIVLADEPTGNLDSATGAQALVLLRRACDEQAQTIVMVTHDRRAADVADRVVFLRDGVIVT